MYDTFNEPGNVPISISVSYLIIYDYIVEAESEV